MHGQRFPGEGGFGDRSPGVHDREAAASVGSARAADSGACRRQPIGR
jgi:hypothetical protein